MRIGQREIGSEHPTYIIAEIGVNHDGHVHTAIELATAASHVGADAIKLQYFKARALLSGKAQLAMYQQATGSTDPFEMLEALELTLAEAAEVVAHAHHIGLHAIVTVFSVEHVSAADALPWDGYKVASPDIINRPLIDSLAQTGRQLILSTGAATLLEVKRAVEWMGDREFAMLQCVSSYPVPDQMASLEGIEALRKMGAAVVGYSDHTEGINTGARAVAAGACILERHLTYDRTANGPDHAASLDPSQFRRYVEQARAQTIGVRPHCEAAKDVLAIERDVRQVSRQSITTTAALPAGHRLRRSDLTIKRPGIGIEPWRLEGVVGATLVQPVGADTPLLEIDLA